MNRSRTIAIACAVGAIALVAAAAPLTGPSAFDLSWRTIDGGGGSSFGGSFEITGTIGQPDASTQLLTGESFSLRGGFWVSSAPGVPPCPADLNGDGSVGPADLGTLLGSWGMPGCGGSQPCPADLNSDGSVGPADLGALLGSWGSCPT